jgi:hypothetical protein
VMAHCGFPLVLPLITLTPMQSLLALVMPQSWHT